MTFLRLRWRKAILEIDGVEYLKFISEKAGTAGNGQRIRFIFLNDGKDFVSSSLNGGIIEIRIRIVNNRATFERRYDGNADVAKLIELEFVGAFKDAGFFNDPAFAHLFDGRTYNLTLDVGGGRVQTAPTPATGTEVSEDEPEVLTRQGESTETHIHDYQINLDNTDDNAPVFGQTARIGIKGASDDGQGTVIDAAVVGSVEDQDLIITAKIVGTAGNTITVEFEIGSASGRGVEKYNGRWKCD